MLWNLVCNSMNLKNDIRGKLLSRFTDLLRNALEKGNSENVLSYLDKAVELFEITKSLSLTLLRNIIDLFP